MILLTIIHSSGAVLFCSVLSCWNGVVAASSSCAECQPSELPSGPPLTPFLTLPLGRRVSSAPPTPLLFGPWLPGRKHLNITEASSSHMPRIVYSWGGKSI